MKWTRLTLAALLLMLVGACAYPTGPRYPQEKDKDPNDPNDGDQQGFVVTHLETFWV